VNVISTVLLQTWAYDEGLQRASALGVVMFALTMTLVVIAQRIGGQSIVVDQSKPGAGATGVSIG
jgi:ABC-type Fe3+ transport system permease subunit